MQESVSHEKGHCSDDTAGVIGMVKLAVVGILHRSIDDDPPTCEELRQDPRLARGARCSWNISGQNTRLINLHSGHLNQEKHSPANSDNEQLQSDQEAISV